MSKSNIEWTDETWNPTTGCTLISPGCAHCYAKTLHDMRHKARNAGKEVPATYSVPFETLTMHESRLDALPLGGRPRRVFVNSMSDLFHADVPFDFIDKVFVQMALRPQMTFQILTKRADRMAEYFNAPLMYDRARTIRQRMLDDQDGEKDERLFDRYIEAIDRLSVRKDHPPEWPLKNVWLGVSTENQKFYDERWAWLKETPAAVRFLSIEPMLSQINLKFTRKYEWAKAGGPNECQHGYAAGVPCQQCKPNIDWVIVGGESGAGARPMHPDWARSIRDQCQAAGVPYFFKQWGDFPAMPETEWRAKSDLGPVPLLKYTQRKDARERDGWLRLAVSGRKLDGREWNEFPEAW